MSKYSLKLFIEGYALESARVIANLVRFCEEHLPDKYHLEIIDILEKPELAEKYKISHTPALVKETPNPPQKLMGEFSDYEKLLISILTVDPTVG
jgi:circadian clock protein KaiB